MKQTLNIAHRGARSLAPENTIAAARKAVEVGADMWEMDVQLTADEELIVMHDNKLPRTSDARQRFPDRRPWKVSDFTLSEIQSLDCGSWFNEQDPFDQIEDGAVSARDQQTYASERAPTLREALQFTRDSDWRVNVELKGLSGESQGQLMVQKVVALIGELDVVERVIVSSFNHDYLRQVRRLSPSISTAVLSVLAIRRPVRYLEAIGAAAYNPGRSAVRSRMVQTLRSSGLDVYVWTVNDERTMRKLIRMGVSGIITDFPQTLSALLAEE
jgi:glycerophosphoryl diester phosphodiesterase